MPCPRDISKKSMKPKKRKAKPRLDHNMATPTTAPIITPYHPALMFRAPLLLVALAVLFVEVELEEDLVVIVAVAGLDWAGAEVAPARGAVD